MKDYLKNPCPCGKVHTVAIDEVVVGSGVDILAKKHSTGSPIWPAAIATI